MRPDGRATRPREQTRPAGLDEIGLAELIERHIDYVDQEGQSVHLASPFVKHFHTRTDDALPTVAAIATLPLVLADGTLLSKRGLDRQPGALYFGCRRICWRCCRRHRNALTWRSPRPCAFSSRTGSAGSTSNT